MSNENCRQCHAPLTEGQWLCAACGEPVVATPQPSAPGSPLPPPTVATVAPEGIGHSALPAPTFVAPYAELEGAATDGAGSRKKWVLAAVAVVALLGVAVVVNSMRSDDDTVAGSPVSVVTTVTATVASTTVDTTLAPATTVVETTIVETTVVQTTVPVTEPPVTEPPVTTTPPPAWVPPAPPVPPVFVGPGAPFAVSEPLAGGRPSSEAQPSLLFAQQVFDQLAANDWFTALSHFLFRPPGEAETSLLPEEVQQEFALADRLSLLLIDATPDPNGVAYDLRVGVVANIENATTSVVCGHLYVEIAPNAKVIQLGTFPVVSQGEGQFQPEDFLNDPARIADLIAKCP